MNITSARRSYEYDLFKVKTMTDFTLHIADVSNKTADDAVCLSQNILFAFQAIL